MIKYTILIVYWHLEEQVILIKVPNIMQEKIGTYKIYDKFFA